MLQSNVLPAGTKRQRQLHSEKKNMHNPIYSQIKFCNILEENAFAAVKAREGMER